MHEQVLKQKKRTGTIAVVTHKVSRVRDEDDILVLVDGQTKDEGNHDDLLERNELYRRPREIQLVLCSQGLSGDVG